MFYGTCLDCLEHCFPRKKHGALLKWSIYQEVIVEEPPSQLKITERVVFKGRSYRRFGVSSIKSTWHFSSPLLPTYFALSTLEGINKTRNSMFFASFSQVWRCRLLLWGYFIDCKVLFSFPTRITSHHAFILLLFFSLCRSFESVQWMRE